MKITKEEIIKLEPCKPGLDWYLKEGQETTDLEELLFKIPRFDWSAWLFTELMTKKQCVEIAIFSARLVLDVFEKEHPNDDRPRKAIEAAEAYLKNPTEEKARAAAYDAAYVADAKEKIIKEAVRILDV
ncbi:hypothetical protein KY339_00975 [Candidatus Woesearchaeota archaeon]|nr:hypothetical protein [Candidatus Woesearchaeota archaeon]